MSELSDKQIIASWHTNAAPWAKAVQNEEVESRKLVTNRAIVNAVSDLKPQRAFDLAAVKAGLLGLSLGLESKSSALTLCLNS